MSRALALVLAAFVGGGCVVGEELDEVDVVGEDPDDVDFLEQVVGAPPPTATTYQLRAITHNIAGGTIFNGEPTALNYVNSEIGVFAPDVVMLQEVCASQFDVFRSQHPGWSVRFVPLIQSFASCGGRAIGQVLASRWPMNSVTTTALGGNYGVRDFRMLCADVDLPTRGADDVRACVVHLRAFQDATAIAARAAQVRVIASTLRPRIATQGQAVVLGGDFNTRPYRDLLDPLYRLTRTGSMTGPGDFHEADQTDTRYFEGTCGQTACRSGQYTLGEDRKYDYIFFSRNHARGALSGYAAAYGYSDHRLFRGLAALTF